MRRPEGFERPETAEEAVRDEAPARRRRAWDRDLDPFRLDAAPSPRSAPGPAAGEAAEEPRRWALAAYAELDDEQATAPVAPLGPDAHPDARAGEGRGSHAQRVDRAWREAERAQRRTDREEAREARRDARAATRERRRLERAEVRRFTADARRRARTALLAAAGLALALLVLVGLVWSPLMAVREVRVEGAERLDPAVVQEALAGSVGQPIATVTEESVAERLRAIPQIESFRVDVVPPSSVVVHLVERRPVAVAPGEGGEVVIDAAGVVLGGVDAATSALPRLDGVDLGSPEFEAVASVLVSVPPSVLEATERIEAPSPSDIRLALASGQSVRWGGAEDSRLKADVVEALLATQDPAVAVVLDVRAPEHPVVRGS
ncbi:FtsQ-type POTRA domain-containing protein [Agrococcus terreus]|uniref:FtsQ-type POTRA domain-containing protein n=1 Tax=Agrococcus terreus TaxID=574649 RepID=UPI00384CB030